MGYSSQRILDYCPVDIHRESLAYSSQRVLDYCPVDSQGVAGLFFSAGSRLLFSRFTGSRWVILLKGFQTIVQQIHRESLGYSSRWVQDYCPVDSQGVSGLFFPTGSRQLSSRFTGSRWVILPNGFQTIVQQIFTGSRCVILLNGFQTIVQQIHRESLGYSSQRVLDYCQVDSQGVAGLFFSTGSRLSPSSYSQGVAGLFFSTGSRLLSSRFTGSRWFILLNGFQTIAQQLFTGSRWVILLNGFQTIVQQILSESLGYSSQRVLDYCPVDSQGVPGLFFSAGSRILSSRFTGSRWVILLNGFQSIVQQIHRKSLGYSSQRVPDYCPVDIHRESLCYSSQRVLDYCPVDSQGVAGLFFSTGSRLLSSRFTGSRWVILLNGFKTIVQKIHRESMGYSSQRILDYCPVDIHRESLGYSSQRVLDYCPVDSQGVAGLFFSAGSRLLFSRFTGSRWVILLKGFQTIVQQIHRESLGYSSRWVQDYCPVDSQGVSGLFFSTGSRQLSSRFTGSRWVILPNGFQTIVQQIFTGSRCVILLNGFQTIVKQIHRESLVYSSQRVPDYRPVVIHRESLGYSSQRVLVNCPVDSQEVAGLFFPTVSRLLSSRYSQGVAVLFFSTGSRLLSSRFTGSRWFILLNGFQTIAQQLFTGSRRVILLNGFQTIVQQILRESLGYSSQRVLDYCPVDSPGVPGLFFSAGSRILSSRFTGSRWVILLNGFQSIVQQIHRKSLGYSSQRVPDYCPVDIHRESLCYSSQRVLDYCPVDSQGVAGLFFSTGSRLLSSRFTGSRWFILPNGFQTIVQQLFTGSRWVILLNGFQTIVKQIHRESLFILLNGFQTIVQQRFTGRHWVILLNGFQNIVQKIFTGSRWVILLNGLQIIVHQISTVSCWVILLNWFQTIVKQIHRESLGYSSQRFLDYCPVEIHRESLGYYSQQVLDYCPVDIHRESLGYSSQRVQDYCSVDSLGVAGLFFSKGSRLLSSRFTGSPWVILLDGFKAIVQQIQRKSLGYSSQRVPDYRPVVIHRESLGYSSQRVLDYCQVDSQGVAVYSSQLVPDYCTVDSQGVAGLFFSTGSRVLSSRFTGSPWVILLGGFKNIVQQIHRESLGYSSQLVLVNCPVDSQEVAGLFFPTGSRLLSSRYSQGVAVLFFSTGSRLLSSRFTGSRWVIFLNGFQTIVKQIHRESLVYSSQRVLDYCQVDSQGVAVYSSQRFLDYCPEDIHRESLGYSSQRVVDYCPLDIHSELLGYSSQLVLDYCQVDSQGVAGLFFSTVSRLLSSRDSQGVAGLLFSTGSRLLSSRYSQGVAGLFFSTGSRLLFSRFTGSRWVILLKGFQTIVQQIHRETLGYSSRRVQDYCPVDSQEVAGSFFPTGSRLSPSSYSQGVAGLFFSTGSRLLSSRFTGSRCLFFSTGSRLLYSRFSGSRWVILLNGFQSIVQQIHRESLGYSSRRVQEYCPVDSQGVAGLFFSTGSSQLSSRFTGSRWVILPNGFQTIVQQIFTGSRCVILLNGFQTIVQQIHRESLGYFSQRVLDYCQVDSQGVAGLFFSTGSRLLSSRFTGSRCLFFSTVSRLLSRRYSQGVAGLFFSTGCRLLSIRYPQ